MRVTSLSAGMLDIRADEGNKQAVTFGDFDFLFSVGRSARNALNASSFFCAGGPFKTAGKTQLALCAV